MTTHPSNLEQAKYWNGDEAAHWLVHEDRYDSMLAPFTEHLMTAGALEATDHVLDVGCGCGSTTVAAGHRVRRGEALGVDLSGPMLGRAAQRAAQAGLGHVRFTQADAQVHAFEVSAYDVVISRFGVMFFADPVAAFANIGGALRPDGRMAVVCWANPLDNAWVAVPGATMAQHVPLATPGDPEAPGPFALADPERVAAVLDGAGFAAPDITALDEQLQLGATIPDAVDFMMATRFAQQLLQGADGATRAAVAGSLADALGPYVGADGVVLGSKAWLVTTRRRR